MAIVQETHSSSFGTGTSISHEHQSSGSSPALVVSVSYIPNTEISGVTFGGQDLTFIAKASQGSLAEQSMWYMISPPTGTNTVAVNFSGSTSCLLNTSTFSGIQQTGTVIFKSRTGAGNMVKELPLKSFSKSGCISLGVGITDNENSYVSGVSANQTENWNVIATGLGINSQAISAQLPVTLDKITVGNVLTEPADWAIVIIGLEGE